MPLAVAVYGGKLLHEVFYEFPAITFQEKKLAHGPLRNVLLVDATFDWFH